MLDATGVASNRHIRPDFRLPDRASPNVCFTKSVSTPIHTPERERRDAASASHGTALMNLPLHRIAALTDAGWLLPGTHPHDMDRARAASR